MDTQTIELEIWDRDPVSDPCKPVFLSLRQVEPGVYEGSLPDDNIVYRVNARRRENSIKNRMIERLAHPKGETL